MADAPPNPTHLARQAALARSTRALPLGRAGQGLRRRLREAGESTRAQLLSAWAAALEELHAAGWGTEDPVSAAIVTIHDRVQLLPDLVWPLGTLTARRPIAAWLDVTDALTWLDGAGLGRESAVALARSPAPWPGWPQLDGPGPIGVFGPPAELAALAIHAGIAWLPAADLARPGGRVWALEALEARAPWLLPLGSPSWLAGLRTLPQRTLRARGVGGALALTPDELEALGVAPTLLDVPAPPRAEGVDRAALARALEAAALADDAEARARAEATALLAALEAEAQLGRTPAGVAERFGAVIDLARRGRSRGLQLRAAFGRGVALAAAADPDRQATGRTDLVEARRLADAAGDDAALVRADAAALLASALDGELRATPDPRPIDDAGARTWRRLAQAAAEATRDDGAALLGAAPELLAAALASSSPFLVGATIELAGGAAVAHGREAEAERLFEAALAVGHPPALTPLLRAWAALLAARRGAPTLARERLLEIAAAVDVVDPSADPAGWLARAAAHGALAAAAIGSDGLAAHLARRAPTSRRARLALGEDLVEALGAAPGWLVVVAAEGALTRPEARQRVARQQLVGRLERTSPEAWPAGLALVFGLLSAATFFPEDARRGLEIAAARGERHVERRALRALVPALAGASPEARDAASRRLAQLDALALPAADDDAPLPLTPDAAAREQAQLVHRAATAAQHATPRERWIAAIESLCGALDSPPPSPAAAADGLALTVDAAGRWVLVTSAGEAARLVGAPAGQPGPIARALEALAPALAAEAPAREGAGPHSAWAQATHEALVRGEVGLDAAVIAPFKRHDLTRGQVRALLHLGLIEVGGLYKALARRWGVDGAEYQRALDFLRRANAALDYRPYRRGDPPPPPEA